MKHWEEVRKNHYVLKANINMREYELCDLYVKSVNNNGDYKCTTYIGECVCNSDINPVFDMFSAFDIESAKAQAENFVTKQVNKKKDSLESELYTYNKILDELNTISSTFNLPW